MNKKQDVFQVAENVRASLNIDSLYRATHLSYHDRGGELVRTRCTVGDIWRVSNIPSIINKELAEVTQELDSMPRWRLWACFQLAVQKHILRRLIRRIKEET